MATFIPARSACVSRMTPGERRLAERLEHQFAQLTGRIKGCLALPPTHPHKDQ
jgi:hypothetical protein